MGVKVLVEDKIYGKFEIEEDVLVELINSPPVQRLKGIAQHGLPEWTKTDYPYYTRYEHSIGVMLLLKKLNAELEEQIAGLLHDVSHTAFSHVTDWLWGDPTTESYQDSTLSEYIKKSEIHDILLSHGFDAGKISDLEVHGGYGLLERNAPALCADRVDYALRDAYYLLNADVKDCINDLTTKENEIVFNSERYAKTFGYWYMDCQKKWWMGTEARLRYYLIADMFAIAIKKGILDHERLYGDDNSVINLLKKSNDYDILKKMDTAFGKLDFETTENGKIALSGKIRQIDPKFIKGDGVQNLSDADPEYKKLVENELRRLSNKLNVNITNS
jgi:uncharacterized protein